MYDGESILRLNGDSFLNWFQRVHAWLLISVGGRLRSCLCFSCAFASDRIGPFPLFHHIVSYHMCSTVMFHCLGGGPLMDKTYVCNSELYQN